MSYEGRVVLDPDNHPIKDYRIIPLTLSLKVEGEWTAAVRRRGSSWKDTKTVNEWEGLTIRVVLE